MAVDFLVDFFVESESQAKKKKNKELEELAAFVRSFTESDLLEQVKDE
jgi:hypothetical protein